eukprot:g4759.t1
MELGIWPKNLRLLPEDVEDEEFFFVKKKTADSTSTKEETESGDKIKNDEVDDVAEHVWRHAEEVLCRMRAAHEVLDVDFLRLEVKAAQHLLLLKSGENNAGENIVQGKQRRKLTNAVKQAKQIIEQEDAALKQKKESENNSNKRNKDRSAATDKADKKTNTGFDLLAALIASYDAQGRVDTESYMQGFADAGDCENCQHCGEQDPFYSEHSGRLSCIAVVRKSLDAIQQCKIQPLTKVHLPGARSEDWLDEPDATRCALLHVSMLFSLKKDNHDEQQHSVPVLQKLAVSLLAQAAPDIIRTRQTLCLPAACPAYARAYQLTESWLYLFWERSRPIVVNIIEERKERYGGQGFLFSSVVPFHDVLEAGKDVSASGTNKTRNSAIGTTKKKNAGPPNPTPTSAAYPIDATGIAPRGFWVSRRAYEPSLVSVDTAPFIAFELIDFDGYKGAPDCRTKCDTLSIQRRVGDFRSGLRKYFLDRPNTKEEEALYGGCPHFWNVKRMHWLSRLGERQKRACIGAVFQGVDDYNFNNGGLYAGAAGAGGCDVVPHGSHARHWIKCGDRTETDQLLIDGLDEYLCANELLGVVEPQRRCVTGRVPFALPRGEDAIDLYLEDLFWSRPAQLEWSGPSCSSDPTTLDDLTAEQLVQAALIGCGDADALGRVLAEDGDFYDRKFADGARAAAAELLSTDTSSSLNEQLQDADADLHKVANTSAKPSKLPKVKTRGTPNRKWQGLDVAMARAKKFRERWEQETQTLASDAMRRSALKAEARCADSLEESAGGKHVTVAASNEATAAKDWVDESWLEQRLRRARAVLDTLVQKRMRWRQTRRGLGLLCKAGLVNLERSTSPDSLEGGRPRLRVTCKGSHHALHGPAGAATLVRPHKSSVPLSGKDFVKSMEKVVEIGDEMMGG